MKEPYYYDCPQLYLSNEPAIRGDITNLDIAFAMLFGALLITALTFVLEHWLQKEIKEMEESIRATSTIG